MLLSLAAVSANDLDNLEVDDGNVVSTDTVINDVPMESTSSDKIALNVDSTQSNTTEILNENEIITNNSTLSIDLNESITNEISSDHEDSYQADSNQEDSYFTSDGNIYVKVKTSMLKADGDQIYYIHPAGSPTATGTRDDPLDSMNSALNLFTSDGTHTIVVMDGIYKDTYYDYNNTDVDTNLSNLIIKSDEGASPHFNLSTSDYRRSLYWAFTGENITIDGLKFTDSQYGSFNEDGVYKYHTVLRFINSTNVLVENCVFDNDGYLINATDSSDVVIKNCNVSNSNRSNVFNVLNSSFTVQDSNLSKIRDSYITNSSFKLINNTICNNVNSNLFTVKNSSLDIINNTFKDSNYSSYYVFRIYNNNETYANFTGNNFTNLTGTDYLLQVNYYVNDNTTVSFVNNSLKDVSLGLNIRYSNLTMDGNSFDNLSLSSRPSYSGISTSYSNVSFTNNNFTNSDSYIYLGYGVNATIENNNFTDNIPSYYGLLRAEGNSHDIKENNFTNNKGNCSIIQHYSGNATIHGNHFYNNSLNGCGHVINVTSTSGSEIYKNDFVNNSADNGTVYLYGSSNVHDNNFTNNSVTGLGGAIYSYSFYNINTTIKENVFDGNNASFGGAIYYENYPSYNNKREIVNNTFINNSADFGGAIYSNKSINNIIDDNDFINNSAQIGGAIFVDYLYINDFRYNNTNNTISNNLFAENNAQSGGAVVLYSQNSTVEGNRFISNNASRYGGGALITSGNNSIIVNNTFANNTAQLYGGAIGTNDSKIIDNKFENNSAYQAGAILTINSTIHNNDFVGNEATRGPAIVYIDDFNYTALTYYTYNCSCENCSNCSGCSDCECCVTTIVDPETGDEIKIINCSNCDGCNCTCENSTVTEHNITLLYNNTGIDIDEDVYAYHENQLLRVAKENNGMYYLYDNVNVTSAENYTYWAYCIEQNNSYPWLGNGTLGVHVDDLYFVRNSLDDSYVGDYLKILISYFYHNLDEDKINVKEYIYIFTDTDYRSNNDRIIQKIIKLANNESTVLENGNNWINGVYNCLEFSTFINPTTRQNLILINGCEPLDKPDFNITKKANATHVKTGDYINYTILVTNNGTCNLHGLKVTERMNSMLIYMGFDDVSDNWTQTGDMEWMLNRTLKVNESAELHIYFMTNKVTSYTNITNVIEARSDESDTKIAEEHIETIYPKLVYRKVSVDPVAYPESTIRFILLVKNIGTANAYNVAIEDSGFSSSQLLYQGTWSNYKGTWYNSGSSATSTGRFTLNGYLAPNQEAGVYVSFKLKEGVKGTTVSNSFNVYLNNTWDGSASNFTRVVSSAMKVEKL